MVVAGRSFRRHRRHARLTDRASNCSSASAGPASSSSSQARALRCSCTPFAVRTKNWRSSALVLLRMRGAALSNGPTAIWRGIPGVDDALRTARPRAARPRASTLRRPARGRALPRATCAARTLARARAAPSRFPGSVQVGLVDRDHVATDRTGYHAPMSWLQRPAAASDRRPSPSRRRTGTSALARVTRREADRRDRMQPSRRAALPLEPLLPRS